MTTPANQPSAVTPPVAPPTQFGHTCSKKCRHKCGEFGGVNNVGKPCGKLAGAGIPGATAGAFGRRCKLHDDMGQLPASVVGPLEALAPGQRAFVEAYCGAARGNGLAAAKMAGYTGANDQVLMVTASMLLRHAKVRVAIQAWMNAFSLSAVELTQMITDMCFVNPGPFTRITADGKVEWHVTPEAWEAHKHWVKGIIIDHETGKTTLLLHDARGAQRDLAKINKLYSDAPNINFIFARLTDQELLQQAEEERRQLRSTAYLGRN